MEISIQKHANDYVVEVVGEVNCYSSHKLKKLLLRMVEKDIQSVVINLEKVRYIDSGGVGALVHSMSIFKKLGLRLALANLRGAVKTAFELTSLSDYFIILPKLEMDSEKNKVDLEH